MIDIALGLSRGGERANLIEFARQVDALHMGQWLDMGLFDDEVEGWPEAFRQAVARTLARGGRIHFNLTGIDIHGALAGDPDEWIGRYTAWELQQIVRNAAWFAKTAFYRGGKLLNAAEVASLGIVSIS